MTSYILIAFLLVCSAFFSSTEIAFAAANPSRLRKAAESGSKNGKWALHISEHYNKALCTILIGNNLVNIASSSVATVIALELVGDAGVAVATGVMTVLLLIFGEILPKQMAKQFCDKYALFSAPLLHLLCKITAPIVWLFMKLIALVSKIWAKAKTDDSITYDDLMTMVEMVEEEGILEEDSVELLQAAIEFDDIEVHKVITHRVNMTALDINDPIEESIQTALTSEYSRIPVYEDSIDNIIGILPVNVLLKEMLDNPTPDIRAMLTEPLFVPQTKNLPEVLDQMRRTKFHLAVVTDDYGGTLGIATMEDILEELVGEIWDETDEIEPEIVELTEENLLVEGDMLMVDFLEYIEEEDPELDGDFSTVNGWVTEVLNKYPEVNDTFTYRNYQITVLEAENRCASKLQIIKLEKSEEEESEDD
ncbi:MAG: HlyC/CorC family transporter [Oscillospiraceae bacterium]|nr:HlyC/CorC family transporter [Oscillospiraceae bacterium]